MKTWRYIRKTVNVKIPNVSLNPGKYELYLCRVKHLVSIQNVITKALDHFPVLQN